MDQGQNRVKRIKQHINQKGVAAVEFAIVLPFLVLLVFGTIEFGLMFYNKQVITNASREGVRAMITGEFTDTEVKQIVLDYCKDKDDQSRLFNLEGSIDLTTDNIDISYLAGDDRSVGVSFDYDLLFSKIIELIHPVTISARTTMRMEPGSGSGS